MRTRLMRDYLVEAIGRGIGGTSASRAPLAVREAVEKVENKGIFDAGLALDVALGCSLKNVVAGRGKIRLITWNKGIFEVKISVKQVSKKVFDAPERVQGPWARKRD